MYTNEVGYMTKMISTPIHGQNCKNLLLKIRLTVVLETCYVVFGI